jgi:tRNA-binding protein
MKKEIANYTHFDALDIRVGTILSVEEFPEAKKPAYKISIDFGSEIGVKKSSAQITELYSLENLIGKQILAVINFPPKQIGKFLSECLVLGVYSDKGVVLISPDKVCANGDKLG